MHIFCLAFFFFWHFIPSTSINLDKVSISKSTVNSSSLSSSQTMNMTSRTRTVSLIWTSLLTCPAIRGVSVWAMVFCPLCPPPAAQRHWPLLYGPNARAETLQPAWTPSLWSGTTITTWAGVWRAPAEPCPLNQEIRERMDTCRAQRLHSQVSVRSSVL